ncbi:hypothetical protein [Paenibacillus sp. FSL R7-0179]|uniref:hypothetical protein n=1 Tax=Paenibacillus sp. FSL R7-0179 TaxID=2921672 RepID=UPI0030F6C4B2
MTEFTVWRAIVDWVEDGDGTVFAACPPGSSVYDYKKCCLIDPVSKKRDEPDIMFALGKDLFFVECKLTLSGILYKGNKLNGENDIDKLLRLKKTYMEFNYDQQLANNYGVDTSLYNLKLGIGYAEGKKVGEFQNIDIVHFIVDNNGNVKMKGF